MNKYDEYLIKIIQNYLGKENYRLDKQDFKLQLLSNQSFPSLKSITDTLDYFDVDNIAAKVPKEALDQLPPFFLAVLQENHSSIIAQVKQYKEKVKLLKGDGTKETLSIDQFKEKWDGTILAIEQKEGDKKRGFNKHAISVPLVMLSILAILLWIVNFQPIEIIYTSLAALGCLLSYYTVREDLGLYNEATAQICNSASLNTNCTNVISSKSATLFNQISLSDASFSLFVGLLFILSFIGIDKTFFLGMSVLSIPVIIYSIYAQVTVIKEWCPLCLAIAGVIGMFALTSLWTFDFMALDTIYILKSTLVLGVTYALWTFVKSHLKSSNELQQVKVNFLKFKRNELLFETLLSKEPAPHLNDLAPASFISFGNPHATIRITAVTNPLCGFCQKPFLMYDKILSMYGDQIKLNLIFNTSADLKENVAAQISQRIIELYKVDPTECYQALLSWYTDKNVEEWQSVYGMPAEGTPIDIIQDHVFWCNSNNIFYTPATIVDGYFFPKAYQIEDLSFAIDYIVEKKRNRIEA